MGIVYEAIQESLGRHVALKTLPSHHLGDATRLERFRREARAAARLHHTHIVPVFGVGEHEGLHYYTMQFIRGHGLDAVLREVKRLRRDPSPSTATEAQDGDVSSIVLACGLRTGRFPADLAEPRGNGIGWRAVPPPHQSQPARQPRSRRRPRLHRASERTCRTSPRPHISAAWPGSASRWPKRSSTPTSRASSTATSSPPTCCSTRMAKSGSPTSAWPRRRKATS